MKYKFLLPFVIIFIFTKNTYSQSCFDERLVDIISSEIERNTKKNKTEKDSIISLLFYKIGNCEYFYINSTPFFNLSTFNGYCIYKNSIIIYSGINDNVAKKLINIKQLIMTTERIDSFKWKNTNFDPYESPRYYKIVGCRIVKYKPNKKHIQLLSRELIRVGYILSPPPPPNE